MRDTCSPHFLEMLVWNWCEIFVTTVHFFIVPALYIWLVSSWDMYFSSVRLHSPICLNQAVQPSVPEKKRKGGGKGGYTHISSPFLGGEHFVPLHNLSFAYKRRSLWVLVLSCTNPRHSNTKCMRMTRSLWCLQNRVDEAKSYTKQLLCAPLANGE